MSQFADSFRFVQVTHPKFESTKDMALHLIAGLKMLPEKPWLAVDEPNAIPVQLYRRAAMNACQ